MARSTWQPVRIVGKGPWSLLPERTWSVVTDFFLFAAGLSVFYAILVLARNWFGPFNPHVEISRDPSHLPLYTAYSLLRITIAYILSLAFTLVYGYVAAYNPRAERIMIPLLDILQSIPVLSFLPGVMLAMVALFPRTQIGVEMGAILLIFTGQVWNMAFSFYSSLKSIPREMREAAKIYRFNAYQRFTQFELPYAAIGLVWNSMMSVAGGWFFLMACEMFVLGSNDFRLPGLGSYLQTAASDGDTQAILWGIGTMIAVIVLLDQVVWRPIIAWAEKFKIEQVESSQAPQSWFLDLVQQSRLLIRLRKRVFHPLRERLSLYFARHYGSEHEVAAPATWKVWFGRAIASLAVLAVFYAMIRTVGMLMELNVSDFRQILEGAGATFGRVLAALLIGSLWTIPVGVAIGFSPRLARIAQPLAQIAASVPATALFPIVLLMLIRIGGGLGVGSVVLLLLGTQWYILFNVIAGAMAIPTDLKEASSLFKFTSGQRWRRLILPGIFPYLITGLVTASGGAWNASIIAEYFRLKDHTYTTVGLGATISRATDSGNFALLLGSTIAMALVVVTVNRLLWRRMYRLAATRYTLET
ncbi:MAG TPA: ABC transporter permease subunit [Tepidisphaeraceae bacterium]|jgi:NitT/TauT family transport system permease protein